MANIILPPGWRIPESQATPRDVFLRRREFVRKLGLGVAALGSAACGSKFIATEEDPHDPRPPDPAEPTDPTNPTDPGVPACDADPPRSPLQTICASPNADLYPPERNNAFTLGSRAVTDRNVTSTYNNYYEFNSGSHIHSMWNRTGPLRVRPWTVEFSGLCNAPATWDVDALERRFGIEERLYRLRCVEAWAIAVPWAGYPLRKLIELAEPASSARYVAFRSFNRPDQAVGQMTQTQYTWPYYEALRLDEALHDLSFMVTGAYGEPLPKQNGAPLRLAVPWKYGFKSSKGIEQIEFTETRPKTFWSDLAPSEYGFYSNVNPNVAHPRWSQATERHLPDSTSQPTLIFNGYGEFVADLYDPKLMTYIS